MSTTSLARMSHRSDPHTSHAAAYLAAKGTKRSLLYGAIIEALRDVPGTPREVFARYQKAREESGDWLPVADLYDIRRRMTELEHDHKRIEPTGGRWGGQRVMRLVEAVS